VKIACSDLNESRKILIFLRLNHIFRLYVLHRRCFIKDTLYSYKLNMNLIETIDLIKYPIISDKTTKLLESNQYTFAVDRKLTKDEIKSAIEYVFNVKVVSVNTSKFPIKRKRVGKFTGSKSNYKKAVLKLASGNFITLFPETT